MKRKLFGRGAACFLVLISASFLIPDLTVAQGSKEQVRVPKRHANVQAGPSSGSDILVIVPQGTILNVVERRGPWVVVELTPELRKAGIPMRWYKSEKQGFMYESTVEPVKPKSP